MCDTGNCKTKKIKKTRKTKNKKCSKKIDTEYEELFKNVYGEDKNVPELVFNDFEMKNNNVCLKTRHDTAIKTDKCLIIVYAPWCGHCKRLADLIFNLADEYTNLFSFAAINIENLEQQNDKLKIMLNVTSVPTLFFVDMSMNTDNIITLFDKQVNEENLVYFININM